MQPHKTNVKIEAAVVIAALATLPVMLLEVRGIKAPWLIAADWIIWGVFASALAAGLAGSTQRTMYLFRHPIDVAVVLLSFPLLPSVLALASLVRVVRLLRIALSAGRALPALKEIIGRRELLYVAGLCGLLVVAAAAAVVILEPSAVGGSFGTAVWWALVTITTVGYGDVSPTSTSARVVAVILMIAGLGLISTLSATIAAFFIGQEQRRHHASFESRVLAALSRIETRANLQADSQRPDEEGGTSAPPDRPVVS
jgi:voltage-gated potassium channel